jgi:hypothetical protein
MAEHSVEFVIAPRTLDCRGLRDRLAELVGDPSAVSISLGAASGRVRALDTTVLVAVVSSAGAAIGVLISGLLQIARERGSGDIIMEVEGRKLKVPPNTPPERLDQLIEKLKSMERGRVVLDL